MTFLSIRQLVRMIFAIRFLVRMNSLIQQLVRMNSALHQLVRMIFCDFSDPSAYTHDFCTPSARTHDFSIRQLVRMIFLIRQLVRIFPVICLVSCHSTAFTVCALTKYTPPFLINSSCPSPKLREGFLCQVCLNSVFTQPTYTQDRLRHVHHMEIIPCSSDCKFSTRSVAFRVLGAVFFWHF